MNLINYTNENIEITKYFNIKSLDENKQETRIGYFASIPRLLEILCTVPLSGLELTATYNIYKSNGTTKLNTITKTQKISYDSTNQNLLLTGEDNEVVVEIGSVVKVVFSWKYTQQTYKLVTATKGLDKNKVTKTNQNLNSAKTAILTRIPTSTSFTTTYLPLVSSAAQVAQSPSGDWLSKLTTTNDNSSEVTVKAHRLNTDTKKTVCTDIIYKRTISAPRLNAPIVENIGDIQALRYNEGIINLSVSQVLKFKAKTYCGATTIKNANFVNSNNIINNTGTEILIKVQTENVESDFITDRHRIVNNVTLNAGQYFVYAYPAYMGKLHSIIIDGGISALNSFGIDGEPNLINLVTKVGEIIEYYAYVTKNPKCLKNSRIEFI